MTRKVLPKFDYDYLVQEERVHSSIYTDPDIFQEEMDKIFHRWWLYLAHESEVREPGDYRLVWMGRKPVIVCRDEEGSINVFLNRCTHRGSTVCQSERGNAAFFRCWYHGWTFDNKGRLIGVPFPTRYGSSFHKEELGLVRVPRVGVYRGFIFGALGEDVPEFEDYLGRAKEMIDAFVEVSPEGEIELRAGVHKTFYRGNWKFCGMDGYHPAFTHKSVDDLYARTEGGRPAAGPAVGRQRRLVSWFSEESPARAVDLGNGHVRLDIWPTVEQQVSTVVARLRQSEWGCRYLDSMERVYGTDGALRRIVRADPHVGIWPNLQLIQNQVRVIRPLAVDLTEVYIYPATLKGVPDELNEMRLRQHDWFYGPAGFGQPDDSEMFERNQQGLQADVNPWVILSRGIEDERVEPDGSISGNVTDEVTQRGQLRQWKLVMRKE
jgi:phenylpropionate dioxygenase-like ring-hydroxylating dioxygenase large terminal subunit